MFKKQKKQTERKKFIPKSERSEVIEVTSKDISEALDKTDKSIQPTFAWANNPEHEEKLEKMKNKKKRKLFGKKEAKEEVVVEELPVVEVKNSFKWTNSPEYEEMLAKQNKKKKRKLFGKKKTTEEPEAEVVIPKKEIIEPKEEIIEPKEETIEPQQEELVDARETPQEEKKELSSYFEEDKGKTKKLRRKDKKDKDDTDKVTRKSKRQLRKEKLQDDIKNQKIFKYNNKRYTKIEDFITYLNEHYLDIEKISEEVLDDENFFGWINNNSGIFKKSLEEYKEIKAKIENKS